MCRTMAVCLLGGLLVTRLVEAANDGRKYRVDADVIETCSCRLFCPCYFYGKPDGGRHCEYNTAVRIRNGHVGDVRLDGALFWASGDGGNDFTKGEGKSLVVTVDPSATPEQREALAFVATKLFALKWRDVAHDVAPITWKVEGDEAHARLGDKGELKVVGFRDQSGQRASVQGLRYWGATRNGAFRLGKATHRYHGKNHRFAHQDRNGFLVDITLEGDR